MVEYTRDFQDSLEFVQKVDPSLKSIVDNHDFPAFFASNTEEKSSFHYLVRNILGQQVSGAAGRAILKRFLDLTLKNDPPEVSFPAPERILEFSVEELRSAGLSIRKAEYVRGLSQAYLDSILSDEILEAADDDEVVDKIVSIRGLGPWTAQMFLIFYLHRRDVFSPGDIGVQRGFRRYVKERPHLLKEELEELALPLSPGKSRKAQARPSVPADLKNMERIVARFSPCRTAFQMILWKISDIQMDYIEGRNDEEAKSEPQTPEASPKKRKTR